MSDPALGLTMLALIVIVIMMGFPTAFTLMGLGMVFGYIALYDPSHPWLDNRVFDLMVERTYGAMNNDTLISIPLFVLMGYVMERGALVDKMFYSIQLAFRRVPASLAVATLIVCTFWGIASGLVGAVVVLMGVIAFNPMLKAGYDVKLASGVITAGGTLGILIPPSVMIIVYAAVAGTVGGEALCVGDVPRLLPVVPVPRVHHRLGADQPQDRAAPARRTSRKCRCPTGCGNSPQAYSRNMLIGLLVAAVMPGKALAIESDGRRLSYVAIWKNLLAALFPLILSAVTLWGIWWYVVIHQQADTQATAGMVITAAGGPRQGRAQADQDKPQELGSAEATPARTSRRRKRKAWNRWARRSSSSKARPRRRNPVRRRGSSPISG